MASVTELKIAERTASPSSESLDPVAKAGWNLQVIGARMEAGGSDLAVAASFSTLAFLSTGLIFIFGQERVAKNLRASGRTMPNATPRSVVRLGWFLSAGVRLVWFILLSSGPLS